MPAGPTPPSFLERTRAAKKIIVVDFGFLGDSVHLLPALLEIKRHHPTAELHTLSGPVGAELLALAPCVDHPWSFPLTGKSPPWWKHWDILLALRRQRFDVVFNFSGSDRSLFTTAFIGAPNSLGYQGGRRHFWNGWLVRDWVQRGSRELPVFEQRRQVLASGGFDLQSARFDLRVPEEARQWAKQTVREKVVHLSINASSPIKEWPLEHWIELARALLAADGQFHLAATASASPRERERLATLAKAVNNTRLVCLESLSIARLAAVLQRSRLQIGPDSGVLHLAMALGVPTLGIFRDHVGMKEWMPVGEQHRHLVAQCRCLKENRADCLAAGKASCLASISVAQVAEEALRQLR
ncbi:MAG TPA: glycosyltransferase family 9 protein [Candidatus Cybelea sp.]|jgi:ADP-heptose:LPS heptosyltransferase|nr:glycosyltransferase family 9 protein [Candidatus Cybelea sp.]